MMLDNKNQNIKNIQIPTIFLASAVFFMFIQKPTLFNESSINLKEIADTLYGEFLVISGCVLFVCMLRVSLLLNKK